MLDPSEIAAWDSTETTVITALPYDLSPPYTGRRAVLDALVAVCQQSREHGRLGLQLLVGETGMGKTRTVKELGAVVGRQHSGTRVFYGRASATPYSSFARVLEERFQITPTQSPEMAQQYIQQAVSEVMPGARATDVAHLLAYLMGLPFADSPVLGPLIEAPQQLESRIFIALRRFLAADAKQGPLVFVLEDLERAGDETINLLHYLVAGLTAVPVVFIATAEQRLLENYPNFGAGEVPFERTLLGPLSDDDAVALLRALCRPLGEIPARLVAHAKSLDGSPRALMELIRLLLEIGIIVRAGQSSWTVDRDLLAATSLPHTYHELAAQRLAAVPPHERLLLEQAAIIGETFWLDAVVALIRLGALAGHAADGPTLSDIASSTEYARRSVGQAVEQLVEREWITRVDTSAAPGEPEYAFANPLVRELIYDRIDELSRRGYHETAAQWLALRPDGAAPERQEQVAYHLERAGNAAEAARHYQLAASAAREGFLNERAVLLYWRALGCLDRSDVATRILIWHDLGSVYELTGEFEKALDAFEHMLRLAWLVAARTKAAVAFNKMGRVWRGKGDLKQALAHLERAADLFEQTGDHRGMAGSFDDIGKVLCLLGRYEEAYEKIATALEWRDRSGDLRSIAMSVSNLGDVQHARGQFDEAQRCYRQALELRREIDDRWGITDSLNHLAVLAWDRGDHDRARHGWLQALDEAEQIGALPLAGIVLCNLGELALAEGNLEEGRRRASEALEIARDIDERRLQAESMLILAQLEKAEGVLEQARALAHEAHSVAAEAGLRESEARALVCLGDVFSASLYDTEQSPPHPGDIPAAQDYYQRGITLLRQIGNEADLARALERFGRYRIERGEGGPGKDILREALVIYSKLDMRRGEHVERLLASL